MIQWMLEIWSLVPLPFLNPAGTWKFLVHVLLKPSLKDFENNLLNIAYEMNAIVHTLNIHWHCPSLGLEWKLTFSSPVATSEFSKFAGILSAALYQSFRIWNSSAVIPSPPLAFFVAMFPKGLLTSHSRMPLSRWLSTPLWLSESLRPLCTGLLCILATSS